MRTGRILNMIKYMLMRVGRLNQRATIYLDLYNPIIKKNIEIHYSYRTRKYSFDKIDRIFNEIRRKTTMLSIEELDSLMERCVIND